MIRYRRAELVLLMLALTATFALMSGIILQAAVPRVDLVAVKGPGVVRIERGVSLPDDPKVRQALWGWEAHDFIGAFAVSPAGQWHYTFGYSNMAIARAKARSLCSAKGPERCRIYATLAPDGFHDHDGFIASESTQRGVALYLAGGPFRAFAVSPYGFWGVAYDHANPLAAIGHALGQCRVAQMNNRDYSDPGDTCQLVTLGF